VQKNRTISFAWVVACAIASPSLLAATPVPLSPAPAALSKVETTSSTEGMTANSQPEKTTTTLKPYRFDRLSPQSASLVLVAQRWPLPKRKRK